MFGGGDDAFADLPRVATSRNGTGSDPDTGILLNLLVKRSKKAKVNRV
jgi:hypothetical protein